MVRDIWLSRATVTFLLSATTRHLLPAHQRLTALLPRRLFGYAAWSADPALPHLVLSSGDEYTFGLKVVVFAGVQHFAHGQTSYSMRNSPRYLDRRTPVRIYSVSGLSTKGFARKTSLAITPLLVRISACPIDQMALFVTVLGPRPLSFSSLHGFDTKDIGSLCLVLFEVFLPLELEMSKQISGRVGPAPSGSGDHVMLAIGGALQSCL